MAGLGLALLAGAAGGLGQGMVANAANRIEDRRQAKRDELAASLQKSQQEFLANEGIENRASQERLTNAQLGVQERLGKLQSDTTKAVAGAEIGSREKLSNDQIKARMAELEKSTDSAERIAKMEVDSRKDIQTLQAEAAQQLGIKPMLGADGKTQIWVRPDGTKVDGPKDANGNEISLAAADTDTDEMKNIKFLMTTGNMTFERAQETILAAKNTDSKLMRLGLFRAMVGNTLVPPTEEELQTKWDLSGTFQKKMEAQEAAGTPAADATTASPDTPAPAASATQPQQLTSAEKKRVIADAKIAIKPKSEGGLGISPVKIIQELQEKYGISRVEAGL